MTKYAEVEEFLKNHQKSWLVTGVAGFIGSNLLEKLLILNQKVIGIDNFITGYKNNINLAIKDANKARSKDMSDNFKFIKGDITDINNCRKACEGVDYVLHQAALGSVPRSIKKPLDSNKSNVEGFLNMLLSSESAGVKKFIYASSSSVYGDNNKLPKIEENIGNPLSPYAVTKIVNELYADVFSQHTELKTIGLRYFNIFGKRQDPKGPYAAVIPKWILAMLRNQKVFINGDGKTSRDFCFIENAVQINLLAAITKNSKTNNQVFNVALNEETSLMDLFLMIRKKINENGKDIEKKEPHFLDFREGDVRHSRADIKKAQNLLKYKPEYKVSEGLSKSIKWYIDNI